MGCCDCCCACSEGSGCGANGNEVPSASCCQCECSHCCMTGCLPKRLCCCRGKGGDGDSNGGNATDRILVKHCNSASKVKNPSGTISEIVSDSTRVSVEENVERTKSQKCTICCKKFTAFLFSTIGLSCLLVAYTIVGGFIFVELEAEYEKSKKHNIVIQRKHHLQKLWNMTEEVNVFHPENWTILAEKILRDYERVVYQATKRDGWGGNDEETELQWTFAGAMLYSITVVTTIGE